MTEKTLESLKSEEKKLVEKKEQYESVRRKETQFLQETEEAIRKEKKIMAELGHMFSQSEDRHFFHDMQQAYQKESRTFLNRMEEDSQDLKRQSNRLEEKVKTIQSEKIP